MTFLTNWKLYILSFVLLSALATIGLQRFKILKQENTIQQLQLDALAVQISSDALQKQINRIEQEAVVSQAESVKRGNARMQDDAGTTCQDAINYGIDTALQFQWDNTIP